MRIQSPIPCIVVCTLVLLIPLVGCELRDSSSDRAPVVEHEASENSPPQILELTEQARKNLKLVVSAARPSIYWRTVTIPGVVTDRPGISDRGVTSPAVGVVAEIFAYPGDTVRPGQRLMKLRLFSEYLQATQTTLFKASQEAKLLQQQIDRISNIANSGAVSGARVIEIQNELQRQQTLIRAAKQELLNRGLSPTNVAEVTDGNFVSTIDILVPPEIRSDTSQHPLDAPTTTPDESMDVDHVTYEVHGLGVELGQTVQAGDLLANLANHQSLFIVGHAFKHEAGRLEQAAQNNTSLQIDFADDEVELWPRLEHQFQIRHIANTIDTNTRTFDFFIPLINQSRSYQKNDQTYLFWRFRPGQRARIKVPIEKFENVFVIPIEGVVREGPDAFVYKQNGDLFHQISVHTIYEDSTNVVIANDKTITSGTYLAQNAAASLRRVLKAQSASGQQPGLHVHADGTVHAAH
jgi:membrane fusion protein, heavy metal efflux system